MCLQSLFLTRFTTVQTSLDCAVSAAYQSAPIRATSNLQQYLLTFKELQLSHEFLKNASHEALKVRYTATKCDLTWQTLLVASQRLRKASEDHERAFQVYKFEILESELEDLNWTDAIYSCRAAVHAWFQSSSSSKNKTWEFFQNQSQHLQGIIDKRERVANERWGRQAGLNSSELLHLARELYHQAHQEHLSAEHYLNSVYMNGGRGCEQALENFETTFEKLELAKHAFETASDVNNCEKKAQVSFSESFEKDLKGFEDENREMKTLLSVVQNYDTALVSCLDSPFLPGKYESAFERLKLASQELRSANYY